MGVVGAARLSTLSKELSVTVGSRRLTPVAASAILTPLRWQDAALTMPATSTAPTQAIVIWVSSAPES